MESDEDSDNYNDDKDNMTSNYKETDSFKTSEGMEMESLGIEKSQVSMKFEESRNFDRKVVKYENKMDVDMKKSQEDIDYDTYKFAVGMKYSLKTQNSCFKKVKYISDEVLTELRQKYTSMEFQLAIVAVLTLFFLRMFGHYIG